MKVIKVFKKFFPCVILFYLAGLFFSFTVVGCIASGICLALGVSLLASMMFRVLDDLKLRYKTDSITGIRAGLKRDFYEKKVKGEKRK